MREASPLGFFNLLGHNRTEQSIWKEDKAKRWFRSEREMEGGEEGVEMVVDSKDLQQQSKAFDKLTDRVEDRQLDSTRVQEVPPSIHFPKTRFTFLKRAFHFIIIIIFYCFE